MGNLREPCDGLVAAALRGTVRRNQLRMLGFERLEPLEQAIVLEIRELRRRFDIILIVVAADLFLQRAISWAALGMEGNRG